jgi:predicted DsbA family dithiol-disulfide isomerase
MEPIRITHFSDTLCVWAYVSQVRIDELLRNFAGSVELEYRYLQVFGNVPKKMEASWKDRGGVQGYNEHVRAVGAKFGHVALDPRVWVRTAPKSSMPSHLFLCAVRLLESDGRLPPGALSRAAWAVREAFFKEGVDVAQRETLLGIAEKIELPVAGIEKILDTGSAHAALCGDLDLARTHSIQASPTLLFNEGRQRLTGNVGYRIIEANIRELLEGAPGQLSWC